MAAEVAWTHHERWDGTGYPRGLRGTQIPLEGRIAAIADVFDALTSDRPYRPGLPLDDALARLRAGAGTHFDPRLVELFTAALPRLYRLQERVLQRQTAVARRVPVLAVAPA
jgi:putative two-component system response regulator